MERESMSFSCMNQDVGIGMICVVGSNEERMTGLMQLLESFSADAVQFGNLEFSMKEKTFGNCMEYGGQPRGIVWRMEAIRFLRPEQIHGLKRDGIPGTPAGVQNRCIESEIESLPDWNRKVCSFRAALRETWKGRFTSVSYPSITTSMDGDRTKPDQSIPLLWQDEDFIIVNKPSGILVTPTTRNQIRTLTRLVNAQYAPRDGTWQLHPCHRLDRDTTGLMVFAKGKRNQQIMMDLFRQKKVRKKYLAAVNGSMRQKEGRLKSYVKDIDEIKRDRKAEGKLAVTDYRVLKWGKGYTVVEVFPMTGRTNQIRIHFSQIGHPLLGDRKYGVAKAFSVKCKRTALHAWELAFTQPKTGEKVRLSCPVPGDMASLVKGVGPSGRP